MAVIGAAAAPLVGIAGETTALPMAIVIAILSVTALTTFAVLTRQEVA
jgi:DHA1 family bicyclomycin/chloramphenicol resistance-like MFS transporter